VEFIPPKDWEDVVLIAEGIKAERSMINISKRF
jgi:hypothetical protein